MKVISIWNPWAFLIVSGHKSIETRSWKAPASLIGQTIGIASTRQINAVQRSNIQDDEFAKHYAELELPKLENLNNGAILGTALLHSCDMITEEDIEDITDQELAFGWYSEGRYAWRLREQKMWKQPVFTRGFQGVWDYVQTGREG